MVELKDRFRCYLRKKLGPFDNHIIEWIIKYPECLELTALEYVRYIYDHSEFQLVHAPQGLNLSDMTIEIVSMLCKDKVKLQSQNLNMRWREVLKRTKYEKVIFDILTSSPEFSEILNSLIESYREKLNVRSS
jgi:hypothetical protein